MQTRANKRKGPLGDPLSLNAIHPASKRHPFFGTSTAAFFGGSTDRSRAGHSRP